MRLSVGKAISKFRKNEILHTQGIWQKSSVDQMLGLLCILCFYHSQSQALRSKSKQSNENPQLIWQQSMEGRDRTHQHVVQTNRGQIRIQAGTLWYCQVKREHSGQRCHGDGHWLTPAWCTEIPPTSLQWWIFFLFYHIPWFFVVCSPFCTWYIS